MPLLIEYHWCCGWYCIESLFKHGKRKKKLQYYFITRFLAWWVLNLAIKVEKEQERELYFFMSPPQELLSDIFLLIVPFKHEMGFSPLLLSLAQNKMTLFIRNLSATSNCFCFSLPVISWRFYYKDNWCCQMRISHSGSSYLPPQYYFRRSLSNGTHHPNKITILTGPNRCLIKPVALQWPISIMHYCHE